MVVMVTSKHKQVYSSLCLAEPFEFVVLTSLMSAHRSDLIKSSCSVTAPDRTLACSQGRQLQQWGGLFSLVLPSLQT
jgi:hypothetical protein